jgi:hypothetical protein
MAQVPKTRLDPVSTEADLVAAGSRLDRQARRRLDAGDLPTVGGERPHLNVVVDIQALEGRPGSSMARLDSGALVTAETARRLACDAGMTLFVLDRKAGTVHVGRRLRKVTPKMRRLLNLRDRTCQHPGCTISAEECQPHHLDGGWSLTRRTEPDRLTLVCAVHHADLHPENRRFRNRDRGP